MHAVSVGLDVFPSMTFAQLVAVDDSLEPSNKRHLIRKHDSIFWGGWDSYSCDRACSYQTLVGRKTSYTAGTNAVTHLMTQMTQMNHIRTITQPPSRLLARTSTWFCSCLSLPSELIALAPNLMVCSDPIKCGAS